MGEIKIDEKVINDGVKDAIAFHVASELTPEAFKNFVSVILSSKDYTQRDLVERLAISALQEHIKPFIEEWIEANKDELRRQVFEKMETELGPALGDRVVAHITSMFRIERKQ